MNLWHKIYRWYYALPCTCQPKECIHWHHSPYLRAKHSIGEWMQKYGSYLCGHWHNNKGYHFGGHPKCICDLNHHINFTFNPKCKIHTKRWFENACVYPPYVEWYEKLKEREETK